MRKVTWEKRITEAAKAAGTYRPHFDSVISTLAAILEKRDAAQKEFDSSGRKMIVEHTNKSGSAYREQNPLLRLINELNRDALAYWRDLGLTPAGLKKIDEDALKKKKESALAVALRSLG